MCTRSWGHVYEKQGTSCLLFDYKDYHEAGAEQTTLLL